MGEKIGGTRKKFSMGPNCFGYDTKNRIVICFSVGRNSNIFLNLNCKCTLNSLIIEISVVYTYHGPKCIVYCIKQYSFSSRGPNKFSKTTQKHLSLSY